MPLKYRADIDGLRAIAVLAVIFFHAEIPGFTGGFIGVDVFFVISGFLISSVILKEINAEKFSIVRFYERRVRRIFPALFAVIAFVLFVSSFLFDFTSFRDLGESITYTTLFTSNILFSHKTGYFDATSSQLNPLLHTWSLAVEEQFYIFFPLLLITIQRFNKKKYAGWLIGILFLSLLSSIYGVYFKQSSPFFLAHTRAWELLTGSILALEIISPPKSRLWSNLLSLSGLSLIIYSICFYTQATPFPGLNAIPPVLGSLLVIYSGTHISSGVKKLLSLKPLVFTGLISYSLYLWHWPLIVFANYSIFRKLTPIEILAIIITTFIISAFSLKFIEQPFRGKEPLVPNKIRLFIYSSITIFFFSIIGITIYLQNGMPYRHPEANAAIINQTNDSLWINYGDKIIQLNKNVAIGKKPPLIGPQDVSPTFILYGDSHANALLLAVSNNAAQYKVSGYNMIRCTRLFEFIKAHPEISTVFIAKYWSENYNTTVEVKEIYALLALGRKIVLITDIPALKSDPVRLNYFATIFGTKLDWQEISPTISEYQKKNQKILAIYKDLGKLPNITVIHPESKLFENNGIVTIVSEHKLLYVDSNHLSTTGSRFITPVFNEIFKKMASSK